MKHAAIARLQQRIFRKPMILQLGFLQAHHIRCEVGQPLLQLRQPHVKGVDVPAGDFHDRDIQLI